MHPLTEGVTVVVTPSARWLGIAIRCGACLDQLVDEVARRDARHQFARPLSVARHPASGPAGTVPR